jgi:hypothetical protein
MMTLQQIGRCADGCAFFHQTCVDAPLDASVFLATIEHVVRCGRVSGLDDAAFDAAGLYGDMQIGTISQRSDLPHQHPPQSHHRLRPGTGEDRPRQSRLQHAPHGLARRDGAGLATARPGALRRQAEDLQKPPRCYTISICCVLKTGVFRGPQKGFSEVVGGPVAASRLRNPLPQALGMGLPHTHQSNCNVCANVFYIFRIMIMIIFIFPNITRIWNYCLANLRGIPRMKPYPVENRGELASLVAA